MHGGRRAATLPVGFFRQDAVTVARGLLGALLVSEVRGSRTAGRIVEVEAYLGADDPASHAWKLRRHARNEALFGPAGRWYVYRSYGLHWCTNLVAGPLGHGSAVLLRAVEPLEGIASMRRRRGVEAERLLCAGPGRLCQAMGITLSLDGLAMHRSAVRVERGAPLSEDAIVATPRIGISRAADWPLRFVERGSSWASGGRGRK
ncbi:MAG: DNA-3-methyladenine glycosylase [Gemmatimonadota bacterium]